MADESNVSRKMDDLVGQRAEGGERPKGYIIDFDGIELGSKGMLSLYKALVEEEVASSTTISRIVDVSNQTANLCMKRCLLSLCSVQTAFPGSKAELKSLLPSCTVRVLVLANVFVMCQRPFEYVGKSS